MINAIKYFLLILLLIGNVGSEVVNITSPSSPTDIVVYNDRVYISTFGGGIVILNKDLKYIKTLTSADGLGRNCVQCLYNMTDKLWYGTIEGVGYMNTDVDINYIYAPGGYRFMDVNDICLARDDIWFATEEGAMRYNTIFNTWQLHFSEDGAILNDLYSVSQVGNRVYFGGVGRFFWFDYQNDIWSHRDLANEFSEIYITDMAEFYGKVLIATTNGLYEYIPSEDLLIYPAFNIREEVGTIFKDGDEIILGLRGDIVSFNDKKGVFERGGLKGDMDKDEIVSGIVRIDDNLICITDTGIYRVKGKKTHRLYIGEGLSGSAIYDIECINGKTIIVTSGGVSSIEDGVIKDIHLSESPISPRCISFISDCLTIGSKSGLYIIKGGETGHIKLPKVNEILECEDTVFVATDCGLYILSSDFEILGKIDTTNGLKNNRVSCLKEHNDIIYIGTLGGGLSAIGKDGTLRALPEELSTIDTDYIFSLYSLGNYLLIGTWDRGLFIYDGERLENITWGSGLRHTDIWAIDSHYPLVFLSVRGCGVDIYDIESGAVVGYISSSDGLGSDYIRTIEVAGDTVYFGSAGGVAIYNLNDIISLLEVAY